MSLVKHANEHLSGFGSHSAVEVEQLQKALGLGGPGGAFGTEGFNANANIAGNLSSYANQVPGNFSEGNALAVEDLDRTLKLVTFGLEHLRLWKDILKERVPQVVHEYNVQNAYGESDVSPFFQMGATPAETDAQYHRDVVQIKYMGTKGAVLHNLTLIQAAHGPVVAREVKNKTIELLARNERAMFEADSRFSGNLEYDGIDRQIRVKSGADTTSDTNPVNGIDVYGSDAFRAYGNTTQATILDAGGADFDEDIAEDAALQAVNNFGMPMDMYLGTDIHSAFSRAFYAKQRTVPGESLTSGNRVTEHMGTLDYRFKPSLFNRPRKNPYRNNTNLGAPSTSSPAGVAFQYYVAAVTQLGEGLLLGHVGQNLGTLVLVPPTLPSSEKVLYYNLYISRDGASASVADGGPTSLFLRRVVAANDGAATITFNTSDIVTRAGLGRAFLLMHDPDVLAWKQLGSMIKYDLAVTTTQYEWLQLLYGTPLIMAPFKNVIIDNIKSDLSVL